MVMVILLLQFLTPRVPAGRERDYAECGYGAFVPIFSVVTGCVVPRVFSPTAQLVVIDIEIVATYFGVYFFPLLIPFCP